MKLFPQQRHVSPFPFSTLAWALDKTVNDTRPIGVSTTSLCLLASSPFPAPPPPPVSFQFFGGSFPAPSPPGLQAFLEKFPEPGRLSPSVHLPNSDSTFPASPQFHSSSSLWPSPHYPSCPSADGVSRVPHSLTALEGHTWTHMCFPSRDHRPSRPHSSYVAALTLWLYLE